MSYFMVHLKIAEKVLARTTVIRDIGAFYMGCLAPDAVMFRPGHERAEKALTHFCVGDACWGYHTNYDDWTRSLLENIRSRAGETDDDFLLGYFAHIYTDIQNTEQLWTPNRLNPKEGHLETFLNDSTEVDSRVMESLRDLSLIWSQLENPRDYILPGLLDTGDMKLLADAFVQMYSNRAPDPDYAFSAVTESEFKTFIDNTVEPLTAHCESFFA